MKFFKRKGSETIERMSEDRTGSPNIWWPPEQLTAHGFTEATEAEQQIESQKITDKIETEKLIAEKTRVLAIDALKKDGKLDASGVIAKPK